MYGLKAVPFKQSEFFRSLFTPLWPNFLVLGLFTLMLVVLSVWRFRKMLS